ncbi:MAG TPA: thiamine pyrophosphate-binding protein [Thermoplasmata archaeon]|nr:thiamine pyrophosphate-binding protein [Thermoplasmata archaeon]
MPTGGQLVGEALAKEGVRVVFTLCGGHILPIYEGCLDQGIRVIDVRHEQTAAFAADGWARVTGEVGVAAVTAGPGVCNSLTAIVNARNSDSPVVVLGGQAETTRHDQGGLQETPHVRILEPVTKWAQSCAHAKRLPEFVFDAFRHAASPRTGPAFLEVPWDVLFDEVAAEGVDWKAASRSRAPVWAHPDGVRQAAEILVTAERPVVIAGTSLRWSTDASGLRALADVLRAPVYLNSLARGALPPDHPYFLGLSRSNALEDADVVLDLGAPFDFRLGYGQAPAIAADARIVMADVAGDTIGHNRAVDVGLVGDVGIIARQLAASLKGLRVREPTPWLEKLRSVESAKRARLDEGAGSGRRPVHALRLAREIDRFVGEDTVIVGDGGNVVASGSKIIRAPWPGSWLDPGRFGCLGMGLPFALAAKLARPEKRVLAFLGDGAFGISGMEIDTLVRHKVPVVAVIGNDGAWAQIRGPQIGLYGEARAVATRLGEATRYDEVAKALGAHGEFVDDPEGVGPAIERAFASGRPAVVNVILDPASNAGTGSYVM